VDVVDLAVAVVVESVARRLSRIRPELRGEVRVADVEAGVEDGHDRAVAHLDAPGLRRVDVGASRPGAGRRYVVPIGIEDRVRLPRVIQIPLCKEERIRRKRARMAKVVRLREGDRWITPIVAERIANRQPGAASRAASETRGSAL
jgi:hypothetical protein